LPSFSRFGLRTALILPLLRILALSLLWPAAANLFRFGPLHGDDLLTPAKQFVQAFLNFP
jgi:hypothetical protein